MTRDYQKENKLLLEENEKLKRTIAELEEKIDVKRFVKANVNVIKNYGVTYFLYQFLRTLIKATKYVFVKFSLWIYGIYKRIVNKIKKCFKGIINYRKNKKDFSNGKKTLEKIFFQPSFKRIIEWRGVFGWNVVLFQRPQHIAKNLSNIGNLYFYEATENDKVNSIKGIGENLYLVNYRNHKFVKELEKYIQLSNLPKFIHIYSTEIYMSLTTLKKYVSTGYKVLYEYIDDISPAISVTKTIPKNILDKHDYCLRDEKNCYVVVTADNLMEDVKKYRKSKIAFACNGVDINHFQNLNNKEVELNEVMRKALSRKKKIIGYYGALASWFDYELIKYVVKKTNCIVVLIGIKYDEELEKHNIDKEKNIYMIGAVNYDELPYYAKEFDVCTIPFLINDITEATSPLKLFEYMALQKPIVTTAMKECKKYESVLIANNKEEYVDMIYKALKLSDNEKYKKLLIKNANDNTWLQKAQIIDNLLDEKIK
ncbi:MAG: glycosyltransferase [bacterium]|nr:glycosyltransferase [bacterium]